MTRTIDGKGSNVETLPGGNMLFHKVVQSWTITVSFDKTSCYPIVFSFKSEHGFEDNLVEIESEADMPGAIAEFVEHCGLTQATLWDAYYLAREEVFVSTCRRENV